MSIVNSTVPVSTPEHRKQCYREARLALRNGTATVLQQQLIDEVIIDLENEIALWENAGQIHGFKP